MKSKIISFQFRTLYLAVALTPFLGVYELAEIIEFTVPVFFPSKEVVKISKDILIIVLIIIGILTRSYLLKRINTFSSIFLFFSVIISLFFSIYFVPIEAILSGFRWLLPFVFFFYIGKVEIKFLISLSNLLFVLSIVGLSIQIIEVFNMNGIYGLNINGLNIRNPGFYLSPSSMAAFSMSSLYFITIHNHSRVKFIIASLTVFFSILLTASGSGLLSFFMFFLFLFSKRINIWIVIFLVFLISIILFSFFPTISGREDILLSPTGRIDILMNSLDWKILFFSTQFGVGTNTFVNLRPDLLLDEFAIISDSMISSSIINFGILFFLFLFFELFISPFLKFRRKSHLYIITFLPFFLSTVLFELFPVNILFLVALYTLNLNGNFE